MVSLELTIISQFKAAKKKAVEFGKFFGIDFDRLRPTEEDNKRIQKMFNRRF